MPPRCEQTVEPEAVIARFVARNHIHAFPQFSSNARPNPLAELQKLLPIAGLQRVATNLVRQGVWIATIQLFLLKSIARKHRPASSWDAAGGRLITGLPSEYLLMRWWEGRDRDGNLRPSRLHRICLRRYRRAGARRRVASIRPTTFGPAVASIISSASGPPRFPSQRPRQEDGARCTGQRALKSAAGRIGGGIIRRAVGRRGGLK
jgi:hypothetical protein